MAALKFDQTLLMSHLNINIMCFKGIGKLEAGRCFDGESGIMHDIPVFDSLEMRGQWCWGIL